MTHRYYPQHKDPRLNEDFRLLYDNMYKQHDAAKGKPKEAAAAAAPAPSNGPSNTTLTGIGVKGVPPVHGTSPFYNQASGQFEYQTPAGAVAPPSTHTDPGTPGQIAFDGGFVYICVATNSWMRSALSGGF